MDQDDEFNDFEEAQPPAPSNPSELLQVVPDLGWNIGIEAMSLPLQSEGADIGSTLQTRSGSFGFAFDLESPLQVDSVQPQMGKIGSVYDLTNSTIIPPFSKQNSLQLPISSTDLFDFNTAIQTQIENQQFQTSETPSFLPVTEFEEPKIQQTQFMFEFDSAPISNPSNTISSTSSNAQYSLDLFDWGKTQISQLQYQQKQIQFKEIVKIDQNNEFNFSESITPSLVENIPFKLEEKKEKQEIIENKQKQEEQFQFNQAKILDNNNQQVKILNQEPNILGQKNQIISQFQSHKINEPNSLNFLIENFNYSQPIIITKLQDSQIRKQSDEFQFATQQPRVEQTRKQSEDFEFQQQTTELPLFQPLQQIQQPKIHFQSGFQLIDSSPLSNFNEVQKQQTKDQAIITQIADADPEEQDEFGDFEQPPSGQQLPISYAEISAPTSAPIQPVEIKKEYSDSYQRDFYQEKKEYLDKFVANLPDYSFLLTRGFLS